MSLSCPACQTTRSHSASLADVPDLLIDGFRFTVHIWYFLLNLKRRMISAKVATVLAGYDSTIVGKPTHEFWPKSGSSGVCVG